MMCTRTAMSVMAGVAMVAVLVSPLRAQTSTPTSPNSPAEIAPTPQPMQHQQQPMMTNMECCKSMMSHGNANKTDQPVEGQQHQHPPNNMSPNGAQ